MNMLYCMFSYPYKPIYHFWHTDSNCVEAAQVCIKYCSRITSKIYLSICELCVRKSPRIRALSLSRSCSRSSIVSLVMRTFLLLSIIHKLIGWWCHTDTPWTELLAIVQHATKRTCNKQLPKVHDIQHSSADLENTCGKYVQHNQHLTQTKTVPSKGLWQMLSWFHPHRCR